VTNRGPSLAPNVSVTDPLPPALTLLSNSVPPGGTFGQSNGVFTWSLSSLAVNAGASMSLFTRATSDGTFTNTVSAQSDVAEPVPGNNSKAVSITINPNPNAPVLKITRSGTNVVLSWATNAHGYFLQNTTNLSASGIWTTNGLVPRLGAGLFLGQWAVT